MNIEEIVEECVSMEINDEPVRFEFTGNLSQLTAMIYNKREEFRKEGQVGLSRSNGRNVMAVCTEVVEKF